MSANELSANLWHERELLELLEYRLNTQHLLLSSGASQFVARATDEVGTVTRALSAAYLARDVAIVGLDDEWGIAENASFRQIIEDAPETVWVDIFNGHLIALLDLAERVKTLRDANMRLIAAAARSTQETLAHFDNTASTYDVRGHAGSQSVTAGIIDKDI